MLDEKTTLLVNKIVIFMSLSGLMTILLKFKGLSSRIDKGPFNNYVDKMRGGRGLKNGKILST